MSGMGISLAGISGSAVCDGRFDLNGFTLLNSKNICRRIKKEVHLIYNTHVIAVLFFFPPFNFSGVPCE
jgi:hypothetical protein